MGEGQGAVGKSKKAGSSLLYLSYCLLPLASCLAVAACGYQFQVEGPGPVIGGAAAAPPSKLAGKPPPRMRVTIFENKAFEPNLEIKYTTYTRHEFSAGSGAMVVADGEPADLILKGQILSVSGGLTMAG